MTLEELKESDEKSAWKRIDDAICKSIQQAGSGIWHHAKAINTFDQLPILIAQLQEALSTYEKHSKNRI